MRRSYQRALSLFATVLVLPFAAVPVWAQEERPLPRLFSADSSVGVTSIRAHGFDRGGPRPLELWAWRAESFYRIASTGSSPDGRFDFGEIPVPQRGLSLAVTVEGSRPSLERVVRFEKAVPAPELVPSLGGDSMELVVHPARYEGELRFRDDATGIVIARWPIDATREGTSVIDLFELLGRDPPRNIRVQQVLEDGRVSGSAFYRFAPRGTLD